VDDNFLAIGAHLIFFSWGIWNLGIWIFLGETFIGSKTARKKDLGCRNNKRKSPLKNENSYNLQIERI